MSLSHLLPMGIVAIYNTYLTLLKQQTLAGHIFFKACMLVGTDVIRLQIGKNTVIKHKSLGAVLHQRLGGHLHHHRVKSGIHHLGKGLLQDVGLRCCIQRRNMLFTNNGFNGTHQPHLMTCILQNGFHQISGRGLALGTGDTDNIQFIRRIAEMCCGDKCHGVSGIFHLDYGDIFVCHFLHRL